MSIAEEIRRLAELRDAGHITDEEFQSSKARLLGAKSASSFPTVSANNPVNGLRRSVSDRWLGGVCGGLARTTGLESWVWRLLFALVFLFGGFGLLVYVILWIFIPSE